MNTTHETPNSANPSQTSDDKAQREENGQFRKGNRGGPGNPFARQVAQLRKAALEAVSADDVRDIINALKEKAKSGDVAAKLLLSYSTISANRSGQT